MKVEILGDGCAKCRRLQDNVTRAVEKLQRHDIEVTVTGSPERLAYYSLLNLPALAVDEKIVQKGKVLSIEEITELLS